MTNRLVTAADDHGREGSHLAQRAIREYQAKRLLARHWPEFGGPDPTPGQRILGVASAEDVAAAPQRHPWLTSCRLVVKPDVLAGRRGKHGLVLLDADWQQVASWLNERLGTWAEVGGIGGQLTHFLVEPYEEVRQELYLSIRAERRADVVSFSTSGGMDVEEHWHRLTSMELPIWPRAASPDWHPLLGGAGDVAGLTQFVEALYRYFVELGFTFLEINPLALTPRGLVPLDLKCRLDDTAGFIAAERWGQLDFPSPFGRDATPEEQYVSVLDARSGASLKLTVLNPDGLLWTLVAGGGASVVYADTIADLGFAGELANYGEYSGNPSADETYEYARAVIRLMTRNAAPQGLSKHLLIGGGIANFTDVAATFEGIIRALREEQAALRETPVEIWVRRGGPNYEEGLRLMALLGEEIGVPVTVCGPDTHMTRIVAMALDALGVKADRGGNGR